MIGHSPWDQTELDRLVLAADFGTSGVKVGIADHRLTLLATTTRRYPLSRPTAGQAEQNPEDWWQAFRDAVAELNARAPGLVARIASVSISAQMCGLVCCDAAARPLRPAIIWLDKRAADLTRRLIGGFPTVAGYNVTSMVRWLRIANGAPSRNGMDPPSKMIWVRDHEPDIWRASHKLLDVRDWLVARATGRFISTADTANLTWLMDTRPGREGWSPALCRFVGIPVERLPDIIDGSDVVGSLTTAAAADLGLSTAVTLVGGCSDVVAAALGSGAVADGELHIYAGTSSWVGCFLPDRRVSVAHAYATVTSPLEFRPLLVAAQDNCGSALEWLHDIVCAGDDGDLGHFLASTAARDVHDPLFLPWLSGERCPVDDHRLRGAFLGLGLNHRRETLSRAVMDGVALELRWAFEVVSRERGIRKDAPVRLIGGLARSALFAQTVADAIGSPVTVSQPLFSGLVGAASLSAKALGWAADPCTILTAGRIEDRTEYLADARGRALLDQRWTEFHAARKALTPWFRRRLAAIERLGNKMR